MSIIGPDSKVHGAHMGPTWDQQDPGGPHVGPMNLAIWGVIGRIMKYPSVISNSVWLT